MTEETDPMTLIQDLERATPALALCAAVMKWKMSDSETGETYGQDRR